MTLTRGQLQSFGRLMEDGTISTEADLAIDLSKVTFADSTGIGLIVALKKQLAKNDHRVIVFGLSGQPMDIIKLTRIDRSIDVFPDLESFIASLDEDDRQEVAAALAQNG